MESRGLLRNATGLRALETTRLSNQCEDNVSENLNFHICRPKGELSIDLYDSEHRGTGTDSQIVYPAHAVSSYANMQG